MGNLVAAFGPLSTSWLRWVFGLAEDAEQTDLAGKKCANGVYQTSFWECLFEISYAPNTFACRPSFNKKYYKIKSAGRILSFRPFDDPSHMAISFISARANWCVFHHPQRFDQLVCWKKLKCLTTERVFRTGTRCQLMDRRPRSATSCLGHNLSSSSYFVLGSNR